MNMALLLAERGYTIVVVSDSKGGIYDAQGLDMEEAIKAKILPEA